MDWLKEVIEKFDCKAYMKATFMVGPLSELEQRMDLAIKILKEELYDKIKKALEEQTRNEKR